MRQLGKSLAAMCLLGVSAATPAVADEPPEATCVTRVLFVANTSPAPPGDASLLAGTRAFAGNSCVTVVADDVVTQETAQTYAAVVISSSVVPNVLATRLTYATVPLLVSEPYLFDDLGLTSQPGREHLGHSGRLDVTAGRLTAYAAGTLSVLSAPGTINSASATTDPDPVVGARVAGTRQLALFGTYANSARVGFFAGYGAVLSPQGIALLKAALRWITSDQPRNDDFADAIQMTYGSTGGSTTGATVESGESSPSGSGTVWWRWKAPRSGTLALQVPPTTVLRVGTGTSAARFAPKGEYLARLAFVPVVAGTTYRFQAADPTGDTAVTLMDVFSPPSNDHFGKATRIEGPVGSIEGHTVAATSQQGEPLLGGGAADSVWYRWTAPADGQMTFRLDRFFSEQWPGFEPAVTVGRGATLAGWSKVAGPDLEVTFAAQAGHTYRIAVDGTGAARGRFRLEWSAAVTRPANDDFEQPVDIAGPSGRIHVTTKGAGLQLHEPVPSNADGSIWYRWTAPANGVLATGGATVWMGDQLLGAQAAPTSLDGTMVTAATTYRIQVPTMSWQPPGAIDWAWSLIPLPPNDHLAGAIAIGGASGTIAGDNQGATVEPGEGSVTDVCETENTFWLPEHARTVWYRWTAPTSGHVSFEVHTTDGMQGFADCLQLFRGDAIGSLVQLPAGQRGDVVAGEALLVRVSSTCWGQWYCEGSSGSQFDLNWRYLTVPPPNDNLADAIALLGDSGTVDAYSFGATTQPGEPAGACGSSSTVWWSWTATSRGHLVVSGPCRALYEGDRIDALTPVVNSRGGYPVEPGVTYRIQAGGAESRFGISWELYTEPANDAFSDAIDLTGASGSVRVHSVGATVEPGEPPDNWGGSAWWRWTAPADGVLRIHGGQLRVYRGTELSNLEPVIPGRVRVGDVYFIALVGNSSWSTMAWTMDRPANDDFADALALASPSGTVAIDGDGATAEPGEPEGPRTMWWTWAAPHDGVLRLDTTATATATSISVFRGDQVDALTPVNNGYGTTAFAYQAGQTYRIAVNLMSDYDMVHLRWGPGTPNDLSSTAAALSGAAGTTLTDTTDATFGGQDPTVGDYLNTGPDVWYRWTAPVSGRVVVDTAGSSFDTLLAIYDSGPAYDTRPLADNDDWFPGRTSRVELEAIAGHQYWFQLAGYDGQVGQARLNWSLTP